MARKKSTTKSARSASATRKRSPAGGTVSGSGRSSRSHRAAEPSAAHCAGAFGGLPPEASTYRSASIVVLPVPYDGTSTWKKGADRGPEAILDASANMELYDIPTASEVWRRGIHTMRPLRHRGTPDALADLVQARMSRLFGDGKFPILLGGEHSVSIGAFRAAAAAVEDLSILQIDAHGDTRERYHGSTCNHACVMARARELCPITQVGIRSIDVEEVAGLDRRRVFFAHEIVDRHDDDAWIDKVVRQQERHVYVTIDLDAFDPALVPATGTPEPGGLSWSQVQRLLRRLSRKRTVIGFDVVELLPTPGQWASDFLAAKLVYRFASEVFVRRERGAAE